MVRVEGRGGVGDRMKYATNADFSRAYYKTLHDFWRIEGDHNALMDICEKFLMKYDEVLYSEHNFGLALDEAFTELLGPMYTMVKKERG